MMVHDTNERFPTRSPIANHEEFHLSMTRFIFVRHAQSVFNTRPELIVGRSNHIPLSARGLAQAGLVGAYLKESNLQFDAVFSSGAVRADTTADLALQAAGLDCDVIKDERLLELSQGPWSGEERDEVYDEKMIETYRLKHIDGSLPGAESIAQAQVRIREFVREKATAYPDSTLLVFSHGLLIRSLVGFIHDLTKQQILALETPNVSLTSIISDGHSLSVDYVGKSVLTE